MENNNTKKQSSGKLKAIFTSVSLGLVIAGGVIVTTVPQVADKLLQHAAASDHELAIRALIGVGANVHSQEDSAFVAASKNGNVHSMKTLFAFGATVSAQDAKPLLAAVQSRHQEAVEFIIKVSGHEVENGSLALDMAIERQELKIVDDLLNAGVPASGFELSLAASLREERIVKSLIASGVDVHSNGDAALMAAVGAGAEDNVNALIQAKADVHARNDMAMELAVQAENYWIVKTLLEAGGGSSDQILRLAETARAKDQGPIAKLLYDSSLSAPRQ